MERGGLAPEDASLVLDVLLDVQPEGEEKIDQDRRAEGCKRRIDEIYANPAGGNPHFIAQVTANAKGGTLENIFQFGHGWLFVRHKQQSPKKDYEGE